jgi:hypothetical protein
MKKDPLADLVEINRRMFAARDRVLGSAGHACRRCGITVWSDVHPDLIAEENKFCTACKSLSTIRFGGPKGA